MQTRSLTPPPPGPRAARGLARGVAAILVLALTSCAYVSKKEFRELWDADGDGWGSDEDCDDNNPNIYPYAPDVRGDGCDADCGMERDLDGDDWPDDSDCEPQDATAYPCADEVTSDDVDHDCDGDPSTHENTTCNDAPSGFLAQWGLDPDFAPAPSAVTEEPQTHIPEGTCGNPATAFVGGGE